MISRWPMANILVIVACVFMFMGNVAGMIPYEPLILDGWNPLNLISYQFLHADIIHLVFNMLFLWVFGNTVCEKAGSGRFLLIFLWTGIFSGIVHNLFTGGRVVGASGSINGIIGFYLVMHPINRVNLFYFVFIKAGTFSLSGFWIILFWFAGDLYHATLGSEQGVAYWAHIGGFASGFITAMTMLKSGALRMDSYDNPTLLDYMNKGKSRKPPPRMKSPALARMQQSPVAPTPRKTSTKEVNIDCPHCGQNLSIPFDMIGQTI
ncbi:MAG: rhomboid family intramembrane serine protease, partial [Verrucomicrobiota bacterium]